MARLDLQPARAAAARLVGRVERLDDDALVAARPARRRGPARPRPASSATARGTRSASRHERGSSAVDALGAGAVEQVLAVERAARRRTAASSRAAAGAPLPNRLAVTWNGCGRPVGAQRDRLAVEHERRATGSASAASTTSGTRAVMSSRLRVKTRTSSPRRWTWMRTPSSFHSTAAGPSLRRAPRRRRRPGEASIGCSGRPTSSRNAAQRLPRRSASATRRDRAEVAAQHQRPAHVGLRGTPAARGDRVGHHARQRALAQLAEQQARAGSAARRSVARANSSASAARRAGLRARRRASAPMRVERARRPRRRSSVGSAAGARQVAQRRPADADLALAQLARQVGDADRHLGGPIRRSVSASRAIFCVRAEVARTAAEVATSSASSTGLPRLAGAVGRSPRHLRGRPRDLRRARRRSRAGRGAAADGAGGGGGRGRVPVRRAAPAPDRRRLGGAAGAAGAGGRAVADASREVDAAFARDRRAARAPARRPRAATRWASCSRAPPSASSASCARCCRASCARARSRA